MHHPMLYLRRALGTSLRHRLLRLALAGMVLCALCLGGYALRPAAVVPSETQQTIVERDPRYLSDMDRAIYSSLFKALRDGDQSSIDTLMSQLENQVLLGHVLATRYLRPGYHPTADELAIWLENYHDHPEAARIASLARRMGVDMAMLPAVNTAKPLKGDGYVFHLGRSSMPDGWYRGLRLWKEGDYATAADAFAAVGDNSRLNQWQRSAGHYWAYRSLVMAGNTSAASAQLARASHYPLTFYGQLALAREGRSMPIRAEAPSVSYSLRYAPPVLRASAFSALGMSDAAELELRTLYSSLNDHQRAGLVALAAEMNLANLQLRLTKQADLSDGEALFGSYPTPATMISAVDDIVPPALVLAVARHESAFRDQAQSSAGAMGMMQMMPATAKAVLRHVSLDVAQAGDSVLPLAERLSDEKLSAKLGATYLHMLTRESAIGTNLMKMLAGYNAGPGAVANWNRTARNINDPLLYLESIPYAETRNYVTQVMAHYWIYQNLMGQHPSSLQQLARGEWPSIS